jgi:hypothetical protein
MGITGASVSIKTVSRTSDEGPSSTNATTPPLCRLVSLYFVSSFCMAAFGSYASTSFLSS